MVGTPVHTIWKPTIWKPDFLASLDHFKIKKKYFNSKGPRLVKKFGFQMVKSKMAAKKFGFQMVLKNKMAALV